MKHGFTLIQLLVVIGYIILLLALLSAAIDKIIYEADLTVCSIRLKGITSGTQLYAVAHNRRYPIPLAGQRYSNPTWVGGQAVPPLVSS